MEQYEHQVSEPIPLIGLMGGLKSDAQEHLTAMGAEGWELVSTTPVRSHDRSDAFCVYFWKRRSAPLLPPPPSETLPVPPPPK